MRQMLKRIIDKVTRSPGHQVTSECKVTRSPGHWVTRDWKLGTWILVTLALVTWQLATGNLAYALYYYGGNGGCSSARESIVLVETPVARGLLYTTLPIEDDLVIGQDGQYVGSYVLMLSGTNSNRFYLIVDSDEKTVGSDGSDIDTVDILCDSTSGFNAGDVLTIVDRVYDKTETNGNVDLSVSGTVTSFITWTYSGTVVLDARSLKACNVYAAEGLSGVKWSDSLKLFNSSASSFGGDAYTSYEGNYYRWGHETVTATGAGGNWSSTSTWAEGVVPGDGQIVIIPSGKTVTVDQDVTIGDNTTTAAITVQAGGTLTFSTSASYTITPKGDIDVYGTLTMRAGAGAYASTIQFDCDSDAQYGLRVFSGGFLDVEGGSQDNRNCIITAVTKDSSHDGYVICRDGSKTKLKFADISYMGANSGDKYGVWAEGIDSSGASEYFYMEGCYIHNVYQGFFGEGLRHSVIKDNFFDTTTGSYGVWILSSNAGYNCFMGNSISNTNWGALFAGGASGGCNTIKDNIFQHNALDGLWITTDVYTNVYNNTFYDNDRGGIEIGASATNIIIKNNIFVSNASDTSSALVDAGVSTTIDYNLFYGNTANGTTGTNAVTPGSFSFVSTTLSNANYMYVAADSPALGAGVRLDTGAAQAQTNIGAWLGYVSNATDGIKYNSMQLSNDAAACTAGDTITTYAVDLATDTIQGGVTTTGALYVTFNVLEATVTADDQYVGQYLYITAGQNRGNYYLIVDSDENTTDTMTIFPNLFTGTITDGFNTGDGFTIVDRVYSRSFSTSSSKDGTAASLITYNTSGTVIRNNGISSSSDYLVIDDFIISGAPGNGVYVSGTGNKIINNEVYNWGAEDAGNGGAYYPYGICFTGGSKHIAENNFLNGVVWGGISIGGASMSKCTAKDNIACSANSYGLMVYGYSHLILKNKLFGNTYIQLDDNTSAADSSQASVYKNNVILGRGAYQGALWINGDYSKVYNNLCLFNPSDAGLLVRSTAASNRIYNNIFAYNTGSIGLLDQDSANSNTYDYNLYYGNSTDYSGGQSIGSHSITGTDPGFVVEDSGTNGTAGLTASIYTSGKSWTPNQWVGYMVRITGGTGSGQGAGIISNTANRLFVAPAFLTALGTNSTYQILDYTVTAASALGGGCDVYTGDASSSTNIGCELGYVKNTTDDEEFNYPQAANDAAGCGAGDTIVVYAVDETKGIE